MLQVRLAMIGIWELLLILLIVVVIFGAGKLPQLGEALGKTFRNFKKSMRDEPKEIEGEARRLEEERPADLPAGKTGSGVEREVHSTVERK